MKKIFTLKFNVNTYYPNQELLESSDTKNASEVIEAKVPDYCVENIMNFAKSYRVADSKIAGKVEMILN